MVIPAVPTVCKKQGSVTIKYQFNLPTKTKSVIIKPSLSGEL